MFKTNNDENNAKAAALKSIIKLSSSNIPPKGLAKANSNMDLKKLTDQLKHFDGKQQPMPQKGQV